MNKITALVAVDYTTPNAKQDFVRSLRETGFGVLKNHPLNQSQVQAIYEQWRIFLVKSVKMTLKSQTMAPAVSTRSPCPRQPKATRLKT